VSLAPPEVAQTSVIPNILVFAVFALYLTSGMP
jgi:hypothetical protein